MQETIHPFTGNRVGPCFTYDEIFRQPLLWPTTLDRVRAECDSSGLHEKLSNRRVMLTGAGTSAYAAGAIAAAWPNASAVPTTDLLVDMDRHLNDVDVVISLARSGDSPESAAVVEQIHSRRPEVLQIAIVCNPDGALSRSPVEALIVLDPRTNDNSLVMTSSFSNLTLAGLSLKHFDTLRTHVGGLSDRAAALLPEIARVSERVATRVTERIVILSSSPLHEWAREGGLKVLEMTGGGFAVATETYLGLRHGPMSFLRSDTVVLCLISNDFVRRLYEFDLIQELRAKKLGYLVGIGDQADLLDQFDEIVPAVAPDVEDALRTPFEIITPQLLGFHLSRRIGLNPDNPSPTGIINRVVQGGKIHLRYPKEHC